MIYFSIEVIYTGFYKVKSWWNFQQHISPFYRIYLITKGSCTITIANEQKYELRSGDLFLVPSNTPVNYECSNEMEHYYICFVQNHKEETPDVEQIAVKRRVHAKSLDYELMRRLSEICDGLNLPSTDPEVYDKYDNAWKRTYLPQDTSTHIEENAILQQLFSRFLTNYSFDHITEKEYLETKMTEIITYINSNIEHKIKVIDLASMINISPDYFSRSFKKIIGTSPQDYIQKVRLNYAKKLLVTTNLSVKEIACKIGFQYSSQLTKVFKKELNLSPTKFRELKL